MTETLSSDEEADFKAVSETDFQRIQNKVTKINYAEGVADGREQVFQTSFDQGYADGLATGFEVAKLHTFFHTLNEADIRDEKLSNEYDLFQAFNLAATTDKSHFKYLDNFTEPLRKVSAEQNLYLNNLRREMATKLPITTNLFVSK